MPNFPQTAIVNCPSCGAQFNAQIHRIIDVGQNPEHKQQFLRGQLNQAICPRCDSRGMLSVPYFYHDPSKELALVFLPTELNLPEADQQRYIGSLTNEAMMNLPPEQRRGYLLQPQIFLRMEGLMKRILAADGITEDMLDAQRARAELIDQFLAADDNEERLKALAIEHKERLDYEFFHTLTASLEAAQTEAQTASAEQLLRLRTRLLELSDFGRSSRAQRETIDMLQEGMTRENLLERIIAAEGDAELRGITSVARSLLDYQFFLMLSGRMDSADGDEARRLRELRESLLTLTQELDREAEAALARSSEVLQAILESQDQEAAVRDHLAEIDDMLLALLSANMRQAEAEGQEERAAQLREVWGAVVGVLEEAMPPQIQLINRLLSTETEEQRRALMEGQDGLITPDFLELIEDMSADLVERGQSEAGERLRSIRGEVATFLVSRSA
jgi:hypothetical protein